MSRLAPSPTGDLHLGNLRTFALNWALARSLGWTLRLRLEDLDAPRVKPGAIEATVDLLRWIGFEHDGPALRQSSDLAPYRAAMERLAAMGLVYSCGLSRAALRRALSAPHVGEREHRCPASMRPTERSRWRFAAGDVNHRFATPPGSIEIVDAIAGAHRFDPAEEVGDFVLWTRCDLPSYQLAVVVDDARQGVTDVVRGDDLLPSAARQALLYRALGAPIPRWWHVPLVLGSDGARLAKRADSRSAWSYRREGVAPERLVGLLARWLGVVAERAPLSSGEFLAAFASRADPDAAGATLDGLGLRPVVFDEEDHRWLLGQPLALALPARIPAGAGCAAPPAAPPTSEQRAAHRAGPAG
ncbi:MAG TPA: glutamate--tRNA ligase family protein [Phycisphaerales bacterium]|nr:glutamate--tRNA ligase family protein [Phycisphaerales bacterium]HMP38325.1 glutamate--tRNA ligase family protein [Phycisphaerales bacterium]